MFISHIVVYINVVGIINVCITVCDAPQRCAQGAPENISGAVRDIIYIYIHIYLYTHIFMYKQLYIHTYTHIHIYTYSRELSVFGWISPFEHEIMIESNP